MRRLLRRGAPVAISVGTPLVRALATAGAGALLVAGVTAMTYPPAPTMTAGPPLSSVAGSGASAATAYRQIFLPDLLVVAPQGLSVAETAALARLPGVRNVITADGAAVRVGSRRVNVLGVDPRQFRSWTPLATASDQRLWTALASGRFVASPGTARTLALRPGARYALTGAARQDLVFGDSAPLGVSGIDVLVSNRASRSLGLIRGVVALISAPGAGLSGLTRAVRATVGRTDAVVSLRAQQLPVRPGPAGGRPTTYLELFQQSAARYCPGLSWTVLAAIGQIESGDGANVGPSSAGALGPMQFLPSTWAAWGITAFGEPGPPNIMDPYDAVPSAARYLCAAGAATPGGLAGAILAYNHATWYVNEVLALAAQYARTYG
jgi:Transglycosylase SLT domain